ncbi:L-lactate permease [Enterobacter roggenkampii]|uniref:L-lactate permease n=1 Tax=Enterobacter roggenkampii TaxID=1812935 RepID=UPI003C306DF2
MPPVVHAATPYAAVYKFDWFSATGTAILFAAILSVVWRRAPPAAYGRPSCRGTAPKR